MTYTDDELLAAIEKSSSKRQILKNLGLSDIGGGAYKQLQKRLISIDADLSHFKRTIVMFSKNDKIPLVDILKENSFYNSHRLKKRLISANFIEEKCNICELLYWRGKKLSLHLDHINGNNTDNRLTNLRLLCPNCHSQTETYCRGNKQQNKCINCEKNIKNKSIRCVKCAAEHRPSIFKIEWPAPDILAKLVMENSYTKVAKMLSVSDNAIRDQLRSHGIIIGKRKLAPNRGTAPRRLSTPSA